MKRVNATLLILTFFLASCVHTEVEVNGNITGKVCDKISMSVIQGVRIELNPGNNTCYSLNDGSYSISDMKMGEYVLKAKATGYVSFEEKIVVYAGKTLNHEILLTPASIPTVSTGSYDKVTISSANIYGEIVNSGGVEITKKGFYFGSDPLKLEKYYVAELSDKLFLKLEDLSDNQTYYFKAFAENEVGEGVGKIYSFTTDKIEMPVVKTSIATSIKTSSVMLNGEIISIGNCPVVSCGFYLGQDRESVQRYVCDDVKTILSCEIRNLMSSTAYIFYAYVENTKGEVTGEEVSFTTLETTKPAVRTDVASNIKASSAVLNATVSDDGGCEMTEYGFYIGKTEEQLVKQKVSDITDNSFAYTYKNLSANTKYYYKAYAVNEKGEGTGTVLSFTTNNIYLPEVSTLAVTNESYTSAVLHAKVLSNGSSEIKDYGFYYGIYNNPTTKVSVGSGNITDYMATLHDLSANTKFYVKAYAVNEEGEGFGDVVSFVTKAYSIPQVTSQSVTDVLYNSAKCTGSINSNGGKNITEKGFCYSILSSPTINSTKVIDASAGNSISCTLSKLDYNKTYYARAYAVNEVGVAYGAVLSFTTKDAPYSKMLDGVFSVSKTQKVRFSGGLLKYCPMSNTWQFAKNQYDYVGASNANVSPNYSGWIDLYGWGTGDDPTRVSYDPSDYRNFVDWGNNNIEGVSGKCRTLTKEEWNYLISRDKRCTFARINGALGWILLPDSWTTPAGIQIRFQTDPYDPSVCQQQDGYNANTFNLSQWLVLENAGAVFIPVAGYCSVDYYSTPSYQSTDFGYWTSSDKYFVSASFTRCIDYCPTPYHGFSTYQGQRYAVRLVQDIK